MSEPSKILSALRDAFRELDETATETNVEDAGSMPKPKAAAEILQRIRKNEKEIELQMSKKSLFKAPADHMLPSRMAAREGSEITPEILDKMRKNREES